MAEAGATQTLQTSSQSTSPTSLTGLVQTVKRSTMEISRVPHSGLADPPAAHGADDAPSTLCPRRSYAYRARVPTWQRSSSSTIA
jgi:hypothetical protein